MPLGTKFRKAALLGENGNFLGEAFLMPEVPVFSFFDLNSRKLEVAILPSLRLETLPCLLRFFFKCCVSGADCNVNVSSCEALKLSVHYLEEKRQVPSGLCHHQIMPQVFRECLVPIITRV